MAAECGQSSKEEYLTRETRVRWPKDAHEDARAAPGVWSYLEGITRDKERGGGRRRNTKTGKKEAVRRPCDVRQERSGRYEPEMIE